MEDTIAAISTALGVGAISIIRVSGTKAIEIVNSIFSKDISNVSSHTIHYGFIVEKKEKVDEVLVSVMRGPKTFTVEDVVEINAHGGINTTNKILELLLVHGCRLAEPGEFTKRAFLNGRIDLTEAEGVMDLINSEDRKIITDIIEQRKKLIKREKYREYIDNQKIETEKRKFKTNSYNRNIVIKGRKAFRDIPIIKKKKANIKKKINNEFEAFECLNYSSDN